MIARTITHLVPSVDAMAVGAQQPQIALVCFPIAQAVVPGAWAALLERPVDVVDVQHAIIGFTATDARATKLLDERKFPAPVARVLVLFVGVNRPVLVAAGIVAKAEVTRLTALLATISSTPSRGEIAVAPAVFSGAIPQPVKVGFKRLAAVAASYLNSALFHSRNIARNARRTKYFDIACKRISEAQRQPSLFVDTPRMKQEGLF